MIKKKRGRYEEIHFLACLNRINVLRGRKMEKLKAKRGLKAVQICPPKNIGGYTPYSFIVINNNCSVYVYNFYPPKFYGILLIFFKVL